MLHWLIRTSKSFNLTEEGRILYAEGEKLLRYIDESQDEIIEKIHRSRRRLRIGIPPVISTVYFSHLLFRFIKQYPNIELEISEVGANIVQNQVDAGSIDIGVVILPIINAENYQIIPAMSSDNALIVNKDHPLAQPWWSQFQGIGTWGFSDIRQYLYAPWQDHQELWDCRILPSYYNREFPVGFPGRDGCLQSGHQYFAGSDYGEILFQWEN